MKQKAYQLDPVSVCKILRSLGWSFLSGSAVFVTSYIKLNDWKLSLLFALAAVLAPFLPNSAVQYKKGIDEGSDPTL